MPGGQAVTTVVQRWSVQHSIFIYKTDIRVLPYFNNLWNQVNGFAEEFLSSQSPLKSTCLISIPAADTPADYIYVVF